MIDDQLRVLFLKEIATQCHFALLALEDLDSATEAMRKHALQLFRTEGILEFDPEQDYKTRNQHHWRIWSSVQSFLIAAAHVSEILWPNPRGPSSDMSKEKRLEVLQAKKNSLARGKTLCSDLGVSKNHVLKYKDFRNIFEHFDERMEEWHRESSHHNYVDMNIGPIGAYGGIATHDTLRQYDPDRKMLIHRGRYFLIGVSASYLKAMELLALEKAKAFDRPPAGMSDATALAL